MSKILKFPIKERTAPKEQSKELAILNMEKPLIVSKEQFIQSTNKPYHPPLSDFYKSKDVSFSCGCGEKHRIGDDGAKIEKRIGMLEFVATCPNDYHTLLLCEVESFGPTMQLIEYSSLMSINSKDLV